jgi:hypothetical protein
MEFLKDVESWQLALVAKPFVMLVLTLLVLYPARVLTQRHMPEGRLKRLLLRRVN